MGIRASFHLVKRHVLSVLCLIVSLAHFSVCFWSCVYLILEILGCVGGPTDCSWLQRSARSNSRTVVKKYKAESAKGKGTWSRVRRKPGASFQSPLSRELHRHAPAASSSDSTPRKLVKDSVASVVEAGHGTPAVHIPNCRAPEGRQIGVQCKLLLAWLRSSECHWGNGENPPEPTVPRCQLSGQA